MTSFKWTLSSSNLYENKDYIINWSSFLPAKIGTKHQRTYFLKSIKAFLIFTSTSIRTGIEYDQSSFLARVKAVRRISRWMILHGLWRFSQLSGENIISFMKDRKGRVKGDPPADKTLEVWVLLFEDLWLCREHYTSALKFDPTPLRSEIIARCRPARSNHYKPLPEEAALALIRDAIEWLDEFGPYIIELVKEFWHNAIQSSKMSRSKKYRDEIPHYEKLKTDSKFLKIHEMLCEQNETRVRDVILKAVVHTEGAAITALLFLVGMRARELARLDVDCIEAQIEDDATEVKYLRGIAAKTSGRSRRWAIFDPIPSIIDLLIKLRAEVREKQQIKALLVIGYRPLSTPNQLASRWDPSHVGLRLRQFANASYRRDRPAVTRLHPHAARKTFAKLAVKRDKRALEPVSWHFGHAYKEFTDGIYVGIDIELVEMLAEEERLELVRSLEHLLLCERLAGKGAKSLADARENFFRGHKSLSTLVTKLIKEQVKIAPCDWGYCIYSKSLSACEGSDIGPNPIKRSPDVCAGCSNFVVTPEHLSWWKFRAQREEEFLQQPNISVQSIDIVEHRLFNSRRIINAIESSKKENINEALSNDIKKN
ncbi:hypothetical protein D3C73_565780 [compost metagenome]